MTVHSLYEYESREMTLSADVADGLVATKAVRATPVRGADRWRITAGAYVGSVTIGGTTVLIRPKVDVARLIFLLGYAADPKAWHDDPADLSDVEGLWGAMAQLFVRQAEPALAQGVLQGYRSEDATLQVVRGRVRENDQLRLRPGLMSPIEVRFDEYDVDIAENRLLRAAAERLLRLSHVAPVAGRRLRHLLTRLVGVRRLNPGERLPETPPSRLNVRYTPALAMARLVMTSRSVDVVSGTRRATGLLFNMNKVFEDFVTVALTDALALYGGRCKPQDPHWLAEANRLPMNPDLVWYGRAGRPAAVVDAKYKSGTAAGLPQGDLYQLLAYCTALDLPAGHLVYAEAAEPTTRFVVRPAGPVLVRHSLNLALPVPSLLERVHQLATDIAVSSETAGGVTA